MRPTITKTCPCNFDPLKPHFYILKLGFTGVYIIFLISAQKHRLWVLVRTAYLKIFIFWVVNFSVCLNRHVFVMKESDQAAHPQILNRIWHQYQSDLFYASFLQTIGSCFQNIKLQRMLNKLQAYSSEWGLKMNTKKIKSVYLKTVDRNKNACTNVQGNKYNEFVHYEIVENRLRDHFNQYGYSSISDSLQPEYYSNIPNGISIRKKNMLKLLQMMNYAQSLQLCVSVSIIWILSIEGRSVLRPLRKHVYSNILKILPPKIENFQIKESDIFKTSAQNIDCGYSLEPPRRGDSNEYLQSMFLSRNKKIMYTPVNPSFTI